MSNTQPFHGVVSLLSGRTGNGECGKKRRGGKGRGCRGAAFECRALASEEREGGREGRERGRAAEREEGDADT